MASISDSPAYNSAINNDAYLELIKVVDTDINSLKNRMFTENDVKELKRVAVIAAETGECNLMELAVVLSALNTIEY